MTWALGFCFVVFNNWILLDFLLLKSEVSCCWQPGWCHCSALRTRAMAFPWWFNWDKVFSGMWVQVSQSPREGSQGAEFGPVVSEARGWLSTAAGSTVAVQISNQKHTVFRGLSPPVINGQPGFGRGNAAPCLQGNTCLCCNYYKELFKLSPQPLQRF